MKLLSEYFSDDLNFEAKIYQVTKIPDNADYKTEFRIIAKNDMGTSFSISFMDRPIEEVEAYAEDFVNQNQGKKDD